MTPLAASIDCSAGKMDDISVVVGCCKKRDR